MYKKILSLTLLSLFSLGQLLWLQVSGDSKQAPAGFVSLFNGRDLTGWKIPEGDNGHWRVVDSVIDYDAESEAQRDKNLWTEREYEDFVFQVDWRLKDTPYINPAVPIILSSGLHQKNARGEEMTMAVPDADSGILLQRTQVAKLGRNKWTGLTRFLQD